MTALTPMLATMLSMSHGGGVPATAGPEAGICTIRLGGRQFTVIIPQALAAADSNDEAVTLEDVLEGILSDEAKPQEPETGAAKDEVASEADEHSEPVAAEDPEKHEAVVAVTEEPADAAAEEKPVEVADAEAGEPVELSLEELASRQGTVEDRPAEEPQVDEVAAEPVAEADASDEASEARPTDATASAEQDSAVASTENSSDEIGDEGEAADEQAPAATDSAPGEADDEEDVATFVIPLGL